MARAKCRHTLIRVGERRGGDSVIYLLKCPVCHVDFEYKAPAPIHYIEPGVIEDESVPAKCSNNHICMYRLAESQIKDA
jgi:hypothetical protein